MKPLKIIALIILGWALATTLREGYSQIGWEIFLAVIPLGFLIWLALYFRKRYKVKDKL